MISFDISDMYPSLAKQNVITEAVRRINDEDFQPSMNKKALIQLVIISVEFMSFSCNGQCFDQRWIIHWFDNVTNICRIIYTKG